MVMELYDAIKALVAARGNLTIKRIPLTDDYDVEVKIINCAPVQDVIDANSLRISPDLVCKVIEKAIKEAAQ